MINSYERINTILEKNEPNLRSNCFKLLENNDLDLVNIPKNLQITIAKLSLSED